MDYTAPPPHLVDARRHCCFSRKAFPMVAPSNDPLEKNGSLVCPENRGHESSIDLGQEMLWFEQDVTRVVVPSRYVFCGAGGTGKSILFTQIGSTIAWNEPVGFILTEEAEATHRHRILRMHADADPATVARVQGNILVEDSLTSAEMLPEFVATQVLRDGGKLSRAKVLFIDSLMGAGVPSNPGRRWDRIFNGLKLCQRAGITTFASAHINKGGAMAGPSALRHNCDCHLVMRQLGAHRLLFVSKNRNGAADPRQPARLVIDAATLRFKPAPHADPVTACARTYMSGIGETEIQSTISLTLGTRRRIVCGTIPHGEITQLLDMISDIRGVDVNDVDFSTSTRVPGARIYSPTMALALSMTLIGSALQQPVDEILLFVGKIDLRRRIRDVPTLLATEIANAIVAGAICSPVKIVCSPGTAAIIAVSAGIPCAACRTLDEAVFVAWPQTR